ITGCAIDPDYLTNGRFYLSYTREFSPTNRVIRIERFTADLENKNAIIPEPNPVNPGDLGRVLLSFPDEAIWSEYHFGGGMTVGPDGKLYAGFGDDADVTNPQKLTNFRGKVLRLNLDGTAPTDNPYYIDGDTSGRNYLYSLG